MRKQHISATFIIADSCVLKSKKRGSSSEAKKEKKKNQKRKKRAELNRKLGVKRLKLQTVVKPKVVQHCRHYLQGRCHEGERCKFSHDVVPLTKSKPCCHFARQSCMKGDDCPYDHQLSKYPCNSYVDTGFCYRGESCLFSHKVEVKEGLEPSAVNLKSDTISVKQQDILKTKQHVDASIPFTIGETTLLNKTLATPTTQPAQRPKGLTFVSVQPKGLDVSQQSSFSGRTDVQPNMVNIPGSSTQQEIGPEMFTGFGTPTPSPEIFTGAPTSSSQFSSKVDLPVKNPLSDFQSDYSIGVPTHLRTFNFSEVKGIPSPTPSPERSLKVSEMFMSATSSVFSTKGNTCIDSSKKSKEVNPPNNSQKALQSALAFAAKYQSKMKASSTADTKGNNLNEGSSRSGSRPSEPFESRR